MKALFSLSLIGLALVVAGDAAAASSPDDVPYFVSLKSEQVFMREGPSEMNRVKWIYHRKGLPMEVVATYDVWRRVTDMDGETGWIHVALLSRDRTAVVAAGADVPVRRREDGASDVVAEAKAGAIGRLMHCGRSACEVKFSGAEGWIDRGRLWGIRAGQDY